MWRAQKKMPKKKKKAVKDGEEVGAGSSASMDADEEAKYIRDQNQQYFSEFDAKQFETAPACEVRIDPTGRKGRFLVRHFAELP